MNEINLLVIDVPLQEGMAGTKRVRNILLPLYKKNKITLGNLVLANIFEKHRIGEKGCIDGIDYTYIGYSSLRNIIAVIKFYTKGFKFIKEHVKSDCKNIVYYYGYPDLKNLPLLIYSKYKKYKLIFDIVEDNRHNQHFFGLAGKIRNSTSLFLLKKTPLFGNAFIVISNPLEKWLKEIFLNKIPIYNIPITVNTGDFEVADNISSSGNEGITIFYGGSFAPKDGLEYMLKAFENVCKKHHNIKLILTGEGQGAYMEKLLVLIQSNPMIEYRGFLSTSEYIKVLKGSDICCMTRNNSLYANAGFPFKLGEFLAAGKAIIATNVGDVSQYLTNGINALLIPAESEKAIEDALYLCIENKNGLRQKIGSEAKKTALKYFDDTILSNKLFEIFKSL